MCPTTDGTPIYQKHKQFSVTFLWFFSSIKKSPTKNITNRLNYIYILTVYSASFHSILAVDFFHFLNKYSFPCISFPSPLSYLIFMFYLYSLSLKYYQTLNFLDLFFWGLIRSFVFLKSFISFDDLCLEYNFFGVLPWMISHIRFMTLFAAEMKIGFVLICYSMDVNRRSCDDWGNVNRFRFDGFANDLIDWFGEFSDMSFFFDLYIFYLEVLISSFIFCCFWFF